MSALDLFALLILLVLLISLLATWAVVGMMPGRIARRRNHPQADAIAVCGWCGVLTMGVLCPLAFIWAYTKSSTDGANEEREDLGLEPSQTEPPKNTQHESET